MISFSCSHYKSVTQFAFVFHLFVSDEFKNKTKENADLNVLECITIGGGFRAFWSMQLYQYSFCPLPLYTTTGRLLPSTKLHTQGNAKLTCNVTRNVVGASNPISWEDLVDCATARRRFQGQYGRSLRCSKSYRAARASRLNTLVGGQFVGWRARPKVLKNEFSRLGRLPRSFMRFRLYLNTRAQQ